jgi:hypothetical protein
MMRLYLENFIHRRRISMSYFLRIAHAWAFEGKDCDPTPDLRTFETCGEIPPYAVRFLLNVQRTETSTEGGDPISLAR